MVRGQGFNDELLETEGTEEEEILGNSENSDEDSDQAHDELPISSPRKGKGKAVASDGYRTSNVIVQTAFDAYFSHMASRPQVSSNVFSELVVPLSAEEYNDAIQSARHRLRKIEPVIAKPDVRNTLFSRFLVELEEGFNILCYGYGSKRRLLNQFATDVCSKKGYVVIANGFQPDFSIKSLLNQIENVPGIEELELSSSTVEKQAQRVSQFFSNSSPNRNTHPHLYIIIHNIDSTPLRTQRAKAILSLLALTSRIHITASIDHLNAPLIWSSSESTTRKSVCTPAADIDPDSSISEEVLQTQARGYAWIWHDLTTLEPYDFELAYVDRTNLAGAHGGGARRKADVGALQAMTMSAAATQAAMSETAALHILASVTQKAQKLFSLLGKSQLESIEEMTGDGANAAAHVNDLQQHGMTYDTLFNLARSNFVATSDTALRALLGEFRDHGLVLSAQGVSGNGEILWIPLRKERLASVLKGLQGEQ